MPGQSRFSPRDALRQLSAIRRTGRPIGLEGSLQSARLDASRSAANELQKHKPAVSISDVAAPADSKIPKPPSVRRDNAASPRDQIRTEAPDDHDEPPHSTDCDDIGTDSSPRSKGRGRRRSPTWEKSPRTTSLPALSMRRRSVGGLFLLLRAYIIIKQFVAHWKAKRGDPGQQLAQKKIKSPQDEINMLLFDLDSNDWLHVFVLDNFVCHGEAKGVTNLHISSSHLYFNSGNRFMAAYRLCDIVRVFPTEGGLEIEVSRNKADVPHEQLLGPHSSSMRVDALTTANSGHDEMQTARSRDLRQSVHLGDDNVAEPESERLLLETKELSYIALHIFDVQSQLLREYATRLSRNLRTRARRTFHVVHFNDVYHLPPFKPAGSKGVIGGASRFHSVLTEIRERHNPLVLFSGDFMGPSLMSVITKGKQMIDAFNFLGVQYGCFGNHEFDYGLRTLKEVVHGYTQGKHIYTGSQTTWLMSNMVEADGKPLGGAKPFEVITWNGITVGLIGLCENWLPQCANLKPGEAKYFDIFETGESLAQRLKGPEFGAEVVIALTHSRLHVDKETTQRCPSIDFLLGGHDHFYKSDPKSRLLKSGQEFEYLSFVEFEVSDQGVKARVDCRPITNDIPQSDYMAGLIERYDRKMEEKLGKPIGRSSFPLDSTEETLRFKEGRLANFLLDIMQTEAEADFAVLGGAAIAGKEVKPPGVVTIGDVFGWFPNETRIMTMLLKGSTICKMLDAMVKDLPDEAPSFPHPSRGLSFTINMTVRPVRCCGIVIGGKSIDPDHEYKVAVEEFVGNGKAKYKFVPVEGQVLVGDEMAPQLVHWVLDYFIKRKGIEQSAANAAREEMIKTISKVISSATRLEIDAQMETSQKFIRSLICQLLHCDRSSVFLVDKNQLHFIPDGRSEPIRFPKHVGLAGHVATTKETLLIKDVYDDERFNREVDKKTGYRTKSMLALPVCLDGENCVAVMQAINKDPTMNDGLFEEVDQVMLRLLGEQVGFQLRNAEIYNDALTGVLRLRPEAAMQFVDGGYVAEEEEEAGQQWGEVLGEAKGVYKSFASEVCLDQASLIRSIRAHATKLVVATDIIIVYLDPSTTGLEMSRREYVTMTEDVEDDETLVRLQIDEDTRVRDVLSTGVTVNEQSIRGVPIVSADRDVMGAGVKSALIVPLRTATDEVLGCVCWTKKTLGGFSDFEEFTAKFFCQFCAVAYQNTTRIESLNVLRQENNLQTVPEVEIGRIHIKGGWLTVRSRIRDILEMGRRSMAGTAQGGQLTDEGQSDGQCSAPGETVSPVPIDGANESRRLSCVEMKKSIGEVARAFSVTSSQPPGASVVYPPGTKGGGIGDINRLLFGEASTARGLGSNAGLEAAARQPLPPHASEDVVEPEIQPEPEIRRGGLAPPLPHE